MIEMANIRVWLTPKGQKKVGSNCILTTDEKIAPKSPYIIVTSSDTNQTYILEQDDINEM